MTSVLKEYSEFAKRLETATKNLAAINPNDVEIATTPKDVVHTIEKTTLFRYQREEPATIGPVLVVYGLIGRQSMIDLQDNRSLVKNLLDQGVDVFEVDWGSASRGDRWLKIDDYIDGFIDEYVDKVRDLCDVDQISMFGICEGGTFATTYAALYPNKIKDMILAITPIDFHADQEEDKLEHGFINVWVRNVGEEAIDRIVETNGSMPGEFMSYVFQMMTPMRSLTKYNVDLIDIANNEKALLNFLRMEKWIADRPDHPGEAAKQWFIDFYQKNKLVNGELEIEGKPVLLSELTMPILNIYATHDHIIPPPCSTALRKYVSSEDYSELEVKAGHVGLFVSGKSQHIVAPKIVEWLNEQSGKKA